MKETGTTINVKEAIENMKNILSQTDKSNVAKFIIPKYFQPLDEEGKNIVTQVAYGYGFDRVEFINEEPMPYNQ